MASELIFRAIQLRFEFEAKDALWFPPGKAGNTFRGGLGSVLPPELFSPRAGVDSPSGFGDRPRPFVLRAAALDGRRFEPGERFALDVNVLDPSASAPQDFRNAFGLLANQGLGPQRARVGLTGATKTAEVAIDLGPPFVDARLIHVEFLTPTEIKFEGSVLREPRFEALFARVRDRVARFSGAPDVDYRALGERARNVALNSARIEQVEVERRSSRTGQRHAIGGFIGEAEYKGNMGEFLPWLRAAEWTGVGRYTVWGNGALLVRSFTGVSGDRVAVEPDSRRGSDAVLGNSEPGK